MARIISSANKELTKESHFSNLKSDASGSSISIYSISKFAINQLLSIGEFGQEGSEIVATHAATAPTGTTVTLSAALTKTHPKDTRVYIIPFNQVEFSYAVTAEGAKTVLDTVTVDAEREDTVYSDTTASGGYFTRWYDSVNNAFSDYSDYIPITGWGSNTVGYAINLAMSQLNKQYSDLLTYDMLIDEVNSCLRYVRGKLKRWSNVQEFDYILDQMNRGEYSWDLPTTYYDKNSNRSMLQVRVGTDTDLEYQDKKEFNEYFSDTAVSQVATQAEVGGLSLVLDSTDDFPSSGTIRYYIANTQYSVDFTANNKTTNTLTTEALTIQTPVDTNIWYGESEGTPEYFSVWDGKLYIWPLCDSTNDEYNIYLDFYTDIVEVDSDADELTLARFDMIKHWLKWQIRNITEKSGTPDFKDGDWMMFNSILTDSIRRESSGQKFKLKPKLNGIFYNRSGGDPNLYIRE